MSNWINKIIHSYQSENGTNDTYYDIGTSFDQVRLTEDSTYTLKKFFNTIQNFFNAPMHMYYGRSKAPSSEVIKVWYEVQ